MLRSAERVDCRLCGVSFSGSEFDEHDTSTQHQRAKGRFLVDRAVSKVTGWKCPGRVGMLKGNLLLDR